MFKLHAEHIINVSKTISRNAFCRVRILESDEIGVAKIDLPIVRVQQHNIVSSEGYMKPSGASPGGHGCPFSSQLVLHCHCFHCCSFPLQWPPYSILLAPLCRCRGSKGPFRPSGMEYVAGQCLRKCEPFWGRRSDGV